MCWKLLSWKDTVLVPTFIPPIPAVAAGSCRFQCIYLNNLTFNRDLPGTSLQAESAANLKLSNVLFWFEVFRIRIRIRIHRINMFLGLPDPYPDPLVRGVDPDPDHSISLLSSSKNSKKNLDTSCFVTSLGLIIFENWCKCAFKK